MTTTLYDVLEHCTDRLDDARALTRLSQDIRRELTARDQLRAARVLDALAEAEALADPAALQAVADELADLAFLHASQAWRAEVERVRALASEAVRLRTG